MARFKARRQGPIDVLDDPDRFLVLDAERYTEAE
jgi:hypothetical protein